jgi:regulatory protein
LLSKRERSEQQIRQELGRSGFGEGIVDAVVERLRERRLVDDVRFAESVVRGRSAKGVGLDRIREELSRLGIAEPTIEGATIEIAANQSELAAGALRIRLRKSRSSSRLSAWRFLVSRGFSEEESERAVSLVFGATDPFTE